MLNEPFFVLPLLTFRNVVDPNLEFTFLLLLTLRFNGATSCLDAFVALTLVGGKSTSSLAGDGKHELRRSMSLLMSLGEIRDNELTFAVVAQFNLQVQVIARQPTVGSTRRKHGLGLEAIISAEHGRVEV